MWKEIDKYNCTFRHSYMEKDKLQLRYNKHAS